MAENIFLFGNEEQILILDNWKYLLPNDFPITVPSEFFNVVTIDTVLQYSPSANSLSSCSSYTHGISGIFFFVLVWVTNAL